MASKFDIDEKLIRKLADLLRETGLTELEYENNSKRIKISRQQQNLTPYTATTHSDIPMASHTEDSHSAPAQSALLSEGKPITSPMVGTVFLAPEPGADPFIQVGDTITEGQTVMLIEAMKTYNPVRATTSGKVRKILVENSTPVEFGEELLLVE